MWYHIFYLLGFLSLLNVFQSFANRHISLHRIHHFIYLLRILFLKLVNLQHLFLVKFIFFWTKKQVFIFITRWLRRPFESINCLNEAAIVVCPLVKTGAKIHYRLLKEYGSNATSNMVFTLDDDMRNAFLSQYLRSSKAWDTCTDYQNLMMGWYLRALCW